jgi:hypothetical protein
MGLRMVVKNVKEFFFFDDSISIFIHFREHLLQILFVFIWIQLRGDISIYDCLKLILKMKRFQIFNNFLLYLFNISFVLFELSIC